MGSDAACGAGILREKKGEWVWVMWVWELELIHRVGWLRLTVKVARSIVMHLCGRERDERVSTWKSGVW